MSSLKVTQNNILISRITLMQLYEEQTFQIIGACMEVHKKPGNGFLESVYKEALEKEFNKRNIPYLRQYKLNLLYMTCPWINTSKLIF
jgi:hypothetical protein